MLFVDRSLILSSCRISSIEFNESATPKSAAIHFEKATAVKTALMLNGGTLDNAHLAVSSEADHPDEPHESHTEGAPLEQTDKPRAASAYSYLLYIRCTKSATFCSRCGISG